jgi:outer membrane protein OmpU
MEILFQAELERSIFATTALIATAGVASADIALSGGANFGILSNGTAGAEVQIYNNASVTASMSSATDNGLEFGASVTFRKGDDVDLDVGDLGKNDSDNDGDIDQLGATSFGNIFLSGAFGTLTFDRDGLDNLMDDAYSHDIMYEYSVGGLSVGVTADIENDYHSYADGERFSLSVVYDAAPVKVTLLADDSGDTDFTVNYALNDMIGLRLNYDTDDQTVSGNAVAKTIIRASIKSGDLSGHIAFANDDDDQWEIGVGYSANGLSLGAVLAEDGAGTDTEMDLTASYDLGGGASLRAATNETGAYFLGAALKF